METMEITTYAVRGGERVPAVRVKQYHFAAGLTPANLNCSEAVFNMAIEYAWESAAARFWEEAGEMAEHHFGPGVRVEQAGRSGGWLLVRGLGPVEAWTETDRAAWDAFEAAIMVLMDYLSSAEYVKGEIEANRWNEEGAAQYNFFDTADGESRCIVDVKRERDAAPALHMALEMAETALREFYGPSDRDNPLMDIIRAALVLASPVPGPEGGRG